MTIEIDVGTKAYTLELDEELAASGFIDVEVFTIPNDSIR